jgi:tRNA 5-methylaminomethyl-2-thiouridine biosynthesis bifunctional protein
MKQPMHYFPPSPALARPRLTWEGGAPQNLDYGDIYGARAGAMAETEYVFLGGNGFPARWQSDHITIAELGFGTGLNFLMAWKQFLDHAPAHARFHFMSVEQAPLSGAEITRAAAPYPELAELAATLAARLPQRLAGIHSLQFNRVQLTLGYGEAASILPQFRAPVDAWFLDGFAPAKNPEIWRAEVLAEVARLGGTIATYTAASAVRKGLEALGYKVEKRPGFGHKRDMLVATPMTPAPARPLRVRGEPVADIAIIGGGIAGCATARALAERGFSVTLYERHAIASGASGNPAALLYPRLTKHWSEAMSFYLSAYSYMLSHLPEWDIVHGSPGLIKTSHSRQEEERFHDFNARTGIDAEILHPISREEASDILGMAAPAGGMYFPRGTWLDPRDLCTKLLAHPQISVKEHMVIETRDELREPLVVLCNAEDVPRLAPEHALKIGRSAGQVSHIPAAQIKQAPRCLYSHQGYALAVGGELFIGATYDHADFSGDVTTANHQRNYDEASAALPELLGTPDFTGWQGRTSFRATTPSRMPYLGKLAPGLYINAGHGSRGMLSAPYGAALLAEDIAIAATTG